MASENDAERSRHGLFGRIETVDRILQYGVFGLEGEIRVVIDPAQELIDRPATEMLVNRGAHLTVYPVDLLEAELVNLGCRRLNCRK